MAKSALNERVNLKMFIEAMGGRLQNLLASTLSDEEKLAEIIEQLEDDVQKKRQLAREIGGQMRAIADPETKHLEPLEALEARRSKLVQLGGTLVDQPENAAQLGQISQEIKSLDAKIASQEATYGTLKGSYELAKANFTQAFNALETVRSNGPAMLKAIEANKQAIAMRDKAQGQEAIDVSFLKDLEGELSGVQAELRSDKEIDDDLDTESGFSIDAALAAKDAASVDADLLAEFKAAAAK